MVLVYASGSISRATILELLSNMAREVELTASVAERVLKSKGFTAAVLDKLSRQDVKMLKDKAENFRRRLLEYMANGRVEVVGFKEFYVAVALAIESAALKLDAAVYRLFLLASQNGPVEGDLAEVYLTLLARVRDAAGFLTDMVRLIGSLHSEMRKRFSELETRLSQVESDADADYRRALAVVIDAYKDSASGLILTKEAADHLEDAVDALYNAGNYVAVIARAEV